MRIVRGKFAGRHLTSPAKAVRPTAEEIRDRWVELLEPELDGVRVVDLFAGSGAIGLEAVSRGARSADFVENGAPALHALKANVAKLRLGTRARIFKQDVIPFVGRLDADAYGIAFADPPYRSMKLDRVVERWLEVPFAPILTLEHAKDYKVPARGKSYDLGGPTRVTILRAEDQKKKKRRRSE